MLQPAPQGSRRVKWGEGSPWDEPQGPGRPPAEGGVGWWGPPLGSGPRTPSMGLHRVGRDRNDLAAAATATAIPN